MVVIAERLPSWRERVNEISRLRPPGVEALAYTIQEAKTAYLKLNRLVQEAVDVGVVIFGDDDPAQMLGIEKPARI